MTMWTEIRRLVLTEKKTKRAICQEYGIHWKTLEKILAHEEPPGYQQKQRRHKPKLEAFLPIIHEILKQDEKAPKKQRHTIKRIFDRLRSEYGYTGGQTVVGDAVREWRAATAEVFMPLSHPPGEAQADFGEATVVLKGKDTKVAYFLISLPYSDAFFCQVFPRECTETFQEGHCRAFSFFGGVPSRISYDNSRIAVARFTARRGDAPTREFLRLQSHFLFEHHFCLVRRPNEKGHTENLIGFARRNFMVPVPQIDDLESFNEELAQRCRDDLQRRLRVIVLDELGYVPASKLGAELLFDVISTAYERQSLIVTTNLPFGQWTEVLGSERLTGAVLDRLTHRCHILEAMGESYRLKDARRNRDNGDGDEADSADPDSPESTA